MKRLFQVEGNLTQTGRLLAGLVAGLYCLLIILMCFLPADWYPSYKAFSTPGMLQVGRFYFLLTPFNSLVHGGELTSPSDFFWVVAQNISNIFLLYPLVLCLVFLSEQWQSLRAVVKYSFCMSLTIECTQLLLDFLFDAGRVFEVDDLWTNTLGGLLAYGTYRIWLTLYPTLFGRGRRN